MGQGIKEWIKQNLWKTSFKTFEVIILPMEISLQTFKGCLPQVLHDSFFNTFTHMLSKRYL